MISKKFATALGTGTLGAGGAAGTAAWKFGLLGDKSLGVNPRNISDHDRIVLSSVSNSVLTATVPGDHRRSVIIKKSDNSWSCELEAVIIGSSGTVDRSEFKKQGEELVEKIKNNETKKEQFVKNCSNARTDGEEDNGAISKIYLDTEKVETSGNKFKFKDQDIKDLLDRDFTGIFKLGDDEEEALSNTDWDIERIENQNKVTIKTTLAIVSEDGSSGYKTTYVDWICYISGSPKIEKTFKDDKLEGILKTFVSNQSDDVEKKKYILRNCMKNNKDIRGLQFKKEGDDLKLEEESLKKITEGMYENPSETIT